ncbi:MAG: CoA-binding protein [Flavobacteriales bacterium]
MEKPDRKTDPAELLLTAVLGASPDPSRYSHIAVLRLHRSGIPVLAVGRGTGSIDGIPIHSDIPKDARIDTVTMYMNADNQEQWHERLMALAPRRIIFNPGAEHRAFAQHARDAGIEVVEACTLVMLATDQY